MFLLKKCFLLVHWMVSLLLTIDKPLMYSEISSQNIFSTFYIYQIIISDYLNISQKTLSYIYVNTQERLINTYMYSLLFKTKQKICFHDYNFLREKLRIYNHKCLCACLLLTLYIKIQQTFGSFQFSLL
ncbi:hypothetical protein J3Q64DRAFT_1731497 [Phycomyces blakesleeanus]|uniref:Transmembrane protein n=1 Tax=Phycomyces blakesleeanus TaxID=4837 RepID=A0ABR3B521_PHYBL